MHVLMCNISLCMYLVIHIVLAQSKVPLRNADVLMAVEWSMLQTSNGAEEAAALLSAPPSEIEAESSSKGSAEPNSGPTPDQQSESLKITGC